MSEIKRFFVSRFPGGTLVEVDLSQIEIVVLAWLTNSKQMKEDVRNGVDFHIKRLSVALGREYTDLLDLYKSGDKDIAKERKKVKSVSFQRSYGAQARSIARDTGLPLSEVESFISAEDRLYPEINQTHAKWIAEVKSSRVPSDRLTEGGFPSGVGTLRSPYGRIYTFSEYDTSDYMREKGVYTAFTPTQIKNYPVQGMAQDIIKCIMGELAIRLINENRTDKIKPIVQVHDDIKFDISPDGIDDSISFIDRIFARGSELVSKNLGINFDLPIRYEITVGPNLAERTKYEGHH